MKIDLIYNMVSKLIGIATIVAFLFVCTVLAEAAYKNPIKKKLLSQPQMTSASGATRIILKLKSDGKGRDRLERLAKQFDLKILSFWGQKEGLSSIDRQKLANRKMIDTKVRFSKRMKRVKDLASSLPLSHVYVLEVSKKTDLQKLSADLSKDPDVVYAHPDVAIASEPTSSQTLTHDQWGLDKIQAPQAWALSQGANIVVAVVDSGVDYLHEDLKDNMWINSLEIPDNQLDDDQNGFIDDVRGWNFVSFNNEPMDLNGHGTQIAGIIAAKQDNSIGMMGVAPQAKIMPVKVFDTNGASVSALVSGMMYAISNGADVINSSFNCAGICPSLPILEDVVQTAAQLGVVVVFSAGESNRSLEQYTPQNLDYPITVLASDREDKIFSQSNIGWKADVSAPGLEILSTGLNNQYVVMSGSSAATGFVSGLSALLMARYPEMRVEDLRKIIQSTADKPNVIELDLRLGYGRINAFKALSLSNALNANIIKPDDKTIVPIGNKFIEFHGDANGPNFSNFNLYFSPWDDLRFWRPATNDTYLSISNGLLATLSPEDLGPGDYVARLVAQSVSGNVFEDKVRFKIVGDNTPLSNITSDSVNQLTSDISGDYIVWIEEGSSTIDLYSYNLSTHVKTLIDQVAYTFFFPRIDNNRVVGIDEINGTLHVVLYDLSAGTETVVSQGTFSNDMPDISGNKIVWIGRATPSSNFNVYLYDIATNQIRMLTQDSFHKTNPVISGQYVAWEEYSQSDSDIVLYDLNSNQKFKVTDDSVQQVMPSIDGTRLVWQDARHGNVDIYMFDISTGLTKRITYNINNDIDPSISGDIILWSRSYDDASEICFYEISKGKYHTVTNTADPKYFPRVNNDRIIWSDTRSWPIDIFYKALEINKLPPKFSRIKDQKVHEGETIEFKVHATDPEGEDIKLTMSWEGKPLSTLKAQFKDNGDGTGVFTWTPQRGEVGDYVFTVEAFDADFSSSTTVDVRVKKRAKPQKLSALKVLGYLDWSLAR